MAATPSTQSTTLSSPKERPFRLNTLAVTVAPPSPSSIHSFDYKMPSSTTSSPYSYSSQQKTPPSTYRKPRSPPLSPTKRKPPPISAPSSPTATTMSIPTLAPGGIAIPSPAATSPTSSSSIPSAQQLRIPRRQYSDERFDTVSSSSGSMASTNSPHTSYSGRTFGYGGGYEHQQQHQQRSPSPPLILSSVSKSHYSSSPRLEPSPVLLSYHPTLSHQQIQHSPTTSSPPLSPTTIASFGGKRSPATTNKDIQRNSANSLSPSPRRATASMDSVVRDPYRSRGVTGLSAKGVKNGTSRQSDG
ncbi:MAG: hypothetical protein J3R72DRAFT_484965 [Linnemannia gamsii]|nr:MAG: hypothetical protein J3R72DRAFT_484965 [Linnemannia gamsii]